MSDTILNAHNTFEQANPIQPIAFTGSTFADGLLSLTLHPTSVVVLTLE
ncbi:hypothetical protein [Paenibacillus psychroresistens]|nr:hypothetical protein [Paenibacillus psychroresistens]